MSNQHPPVQNRKRNIFQTTMRVLLIILLLLIIFLLLNHLTNRFQMVHMALQIVLAPIVATVFLYYIIKPIIVWMEKKGMNRQLAIILIFFLVVVAIVIAVATLIPKLQDQVSQLIQNFPEYWENFLVFIGQYVDQEGNLYNLGEQLASINLGEILRDQGEKILQASLGGLNNVLSAIIQVGIVLFTTPILLFFLLRDDRRMVRAVIEVFPQRHQQQISDLIYESSGQVSAYVRGQTLVAIAVGIMFWIGFKLIGLDYALTLSVIAGVLNMVPYLGSVLATIPALIIALIDSPFMLLKTILVFAIEQLIEGRLIQPLILGNQLKVHPMTILFLLLVAGKIWGVAGVFLVIPVYVVIKVFVIHAYHHFKRNSGLYEEAEIDSDASDLVSAEGQAD